MIAKNKKFRKIHENLVCRLRAVHIKDRTVGLTCLKTPNTPKANWGVLFCRKIYILGVIHTIIINTVKVLNATTLSNKYLKCTYTVYNATGRKFSFSATLVATSHSALHNNPASILPLTPQHSSIEPTLHPSHHRTGAYLTIKLAPRDKPARGTRELECNHQFFIH